MRVDLCLSELLIELRARGLTRVTVARIHYAIASGRVGRPALDGSHRFRFSSQLVDALEQALRLKSAAGRPRSLSAGPAAGAAGGDSVRAAHAPPAGHF
jgi:hypothetical protein